MTVFGRFLSLAITLNTNSFFILTSIKRHIFRVPTTHIRKKKRKKSIFGAILQFLQNLWWVQTAKKLGKSLYPFIYTWYPYSQMSTLIGQQINDTLKFLSRNPLSVLILVCSKWPSLGEIMMHFLVGCTHNVTEN